LTGNLSIRARVRSGGGAADPRFTDPLLDDVARGGPLSRERFGVHWSDTDALTALAGAKRAALPGALAAELLDDHRRLGASPRSLASLDALARGEAVCAVAGQQPAPLGGPLYSLHKAASAVGLASAITERTGVPCVPLFWMHGEDSDFSEIRGVTVGDPTLTLHELSLPETAHHDGALVGGISCTPLAALEREALEHWSPLPGSAEARTLLERGRGRARDLGDSMSALMLALFAAQGLVVVDPRGPAFRAAARAIIDRYLADADALSEAARRAGAWLEDRIGRRPLADSSLDSFVFAIEDGVRRKVAPAEVRAAGGRLTLSPSVALRPVIQDGVLPTVAMACGPGETAYLLQLREVFQRLAVRPACAVPRLAATWLPPAAVALLDAAHADPAELVLAADAVLHRHAEQSVPGAVLEVLQRAEGEAIAGLARISEAARAVDTSLPQMVDSVRAKLEYQYQRLREGAVGKVRRKLEHQRPEWQRLRYYLMPGERWQERRLATLEVAAYRGAAVVAEIAELAHDHARRLADGVLEHAVIEL
jgi:uncharacterized protein YllA (UPF0747 family)